MEVNKSNLHNWKKSQATSRLNLKNAALFLWPVGLSSALIRHENGTFRNQWRHINHVISLLKFPSKTRAVILAFSNFFGALWTNFLRCSVAGTEDRKEIKDFFAILNFARHVLFLQVGHEALELFDLSFYNVENKDNDTIFHGVCIWHHDLRVRPDHLKILRTRHFIF